MRTPVTGLFRRLTRTPPAPGELPRAPQSLAPPLQFGRGLLQTLPGRLVILTSALLLALTIAQRTTLLPAPVDLFRKVVSLAWLGGLGWLAALAISRNRRAFLWRVRRKLILSYVFLGFVPVMLVVAFVLAGGVLLYVTVANYVFQEGYADAVEDVRQIAETAAIEIGRSPDRALAVIERKVANSTHRTLSLAVVPIAPDEAVPVAAVSGHGDLERAVASGPWQHGPPPTIVPRWVARASGFSGTIVSAAQPSSAEPLLVIRASVPTPDASRMVIADLPIDADAIARLHGRTGTTLRNMTLSGCGVPTGATTLEAHAGDVWALFRETVVSLTCVSWADGTTGTASINLDAPVGGIYERLASVNSAQLGANWSTFLKLLILLGGLFLVIQGSALVLGGVLAKSITSAVHELFIGTERVRQGDFAHRIRIDSTDQLGELAGSFNRMSASIERLLHVQREKQRLDDELRIAREIQKSLLPVRPPQMPGIDVADLCEPAREVGGDYYDFFEVGPRQLGVLIADVSGKGTSAALYMAELKGLMLALSHTERSPRRLLIDVNRLLCEHLDNRSFITMTYAVIDMAEQTLTVARAGHTPLIVVSGGRSDIVVPDGMVLGLRLPGASDRFERVLCEHTQSIATGDVIVLYTDGITEAMNGGGDMFGDEALAALLASHHALSVGGIRERVLREVKAFVGDAEPHDDMTMVVLKISGSEG
ncbi:MAG: PP2C family protein-serine/threonine phosphatase [Vicinamibacterales bacterium]